METSPMIGLSLQFKVIKHLELQDDSRVRDYLIHIRKTWPSFKLCPVDDRVLKDAARFLRSRGWELHLGEDHSDRPSRWITKS